MKFLTSLLESAHDQAGDLLTLILAICGAVWGGLIMAMVGTTTPGKSSWTVGGLALLGVGVVYFRIRIWLNLQKEKGPDGWDAVNRYIEMIPNLREEDLKKWVESL